MLVGLLAVGVAVWTAGADAGTAGATDPYGGLDLYARLLSRVETTALDAPGRGTLVYASLRGLVGALDAHSAFYEPEAWSRVQAETDGIYVGVGAVTRQAGCGEWVEELIAGGPAEAAGLRVGECIVAVDGRALAGLDPDESTACLHGVDGTVATLTVEGPRGAADRRPVVVLRARVVDPSVRRVGEGTPVVLRIRHIGDRAPAELAAALLAAGAEVEGGVVLDLRGDPGGHLERAVAIVDRFVSAGTIVSTRGRDPRSEHRYTATASADDVTAPLVVLVDGGTASAAEIIAGALRDLGRAKLVGSTTYGKGSVQGFYAFDDGSMLKLTEARYYLPKGEPVEDHVGLEAQVQVASARPDPAASAREHVRALVTVSPAERSRLLADLDALVGPEHGPPAGVVGADPALLAAIEALKP